MANDMAGMASQFTDGDVRPRAASSLGSALTNSFFPGAANDGGAASSMTFGSAANEGAGAGYLAASQKLAAEAAAIATVAMIAEKAILANRIRDGEGGAESTAGNLARVMVINSVLGLAAGDLYGNGQK